MIIPGFLISVATFPGVIVHELAHQLFCKWNRVAVFNVCYFQLKNPTGFVIHEKPRKSSQEIWIGIGPFILNTILGALIALPAAIPILKFESGTLLEYFFLWLGISIAMHAFPSTGDAKAIQKAIKGPHVSKWLKVIGTPIVGLIYLGAVGSVFWLDLIYGIGVAMLIPNALIWLLA